MLINNKILDKFTAEYQVTEFEPIADKILTKIPVTESTGQFRKYKNFLYREVDDQIGLKDQTPSLDTIVTPEENGVYKTINHGLKDFIPARLVSDYEKADGTDLVVDAIKILKTQLIVNLEKRVADILSTTTNVSSVVTTKWNADGCTIEKDLRALVEEFLENAGISPNTIIIPYDVWNTIIMDETLRQLFTYVPGRKDQDIDATTLLPFILPSVKNVLVPNCEIVTSKKGSSSATKNKIWGSDVYLLYTTPVGSKKTFTALGRFLLEDFKQKTWQNVDPEGVYVKVYYEDDIQIVCENAILRVPSVLE